MTKTLNNTTEKGISRMEDREKLGISEMPKHYLVEANKSCDFALITNSREVRLAYHKMINNKNSDFDL